MIKSNALKGLQNRLSILVRPEPLIEPMLTLNKVAH